jgi:predicted RNase H-like nuclease (RuvC/YqgF family)
VDTRMEALGGIVLRRSLWEVEDTQDERDIASIKADIAQLKTEHAEAKAERKAKLQARIDTLNAKLQEKLDKAKSVAESAGETHKLNSVTSSPDLPVLAPMTKVGTCTHLHQLAETRRNDDCT